MKNRIAIRLSILSLLVVFAAAPIASAQTLQPSEKEIKKELAELKKRFKERYRTLNDLMDAGKVGEIYDGEAGLVNASYGSDKADPNDPSSPTISKFIGEENADRDRLYELLAIQLKTSKAKVAEREGKRRFEKADGDHYLKPKSGGWTKKKDL